ncbi:MAG: hypothetical protein GKS00_30005 [Alphaproteobacteria bacterium]|nr:hypothetical protein [Alphaproteobacteria bacterium]
MRLKGWRFMVLLAAFSLTACAAVAPPRFPEITFTHLPPIKLDVAEIVYAPRYQPPLTEPHVGHEFPQPPAVAAERWIADRLTAVGSSGQARVIIHQATATETKLNKKGGLTGAFTTDQAWRYDGRIEMVIEATNPNRRLKARVAAAANQSRTVPEDATLLEREEVWFSLTENLMRKFNDAFEAQIRKDLAKFVK